MQLGKYNICNYIMGFCIYYSVYTYFGVFPGKQHKYQGGP